MRKILLFTILPLLFVFMVATACRFNFGEQDLSGENDPVVTQAAGDALPELEVTVESRPGGPVTVTLTEEQLTAMLVEQLSLSESAVIQNPQILLRDGQIEVYGEVDQGLVSGDLRATAKIHVDGEGRPDLEITTATLGPFPLPESILESMSTMIEEGFTSNLGSYATGFRIDEITIDSGVMTITGQPR